jgi:hypothetical protein
MGFKPAAPGGSGFEGADWVVGGHRALLYQKCSLQLQI